MSAAAAAPLRVEAGKRADVAVIRADCSGCGAVVDAHVCGLAAAQAWAAGGCALSDLVAWLGFVPRDVFARLRQALAGDLLCDRCYSRPDRPGRRSGRS